MPAQGRRHPSAWPPITTLWSSGLLPRAGGAPAAPRCSAWHRCPHGCMGTGAHKGAWGHLPGLAPAAAREEEEERPCGGVCATGSPNPGRAGDRGRRFLPASSLHTHVQPLQHQPSCTCTRAHTHTRVLTLLTGTATRAPMCVTLDAGSRRAHTSRPGHVHPLPSWLGRAALATVPVYGDSARHHHCCGTLRLPPCPEPDPGSWCSVGRWGWFRAGGCLGPPHGCGAMAYSGNGGRKSWWGRELNPERHRLCHGCAWRWGCP